MNAQASLPGCTPTSTANRAAAEQDARTTLTCMVLSFDIWAIETLGKSKNSLDRNIEAWLAEGSPPHPMITRTLAKMRRHLGEMGTTNAPAWLPQSIIDLLKEAQLPTIPPRS